MKDRLVICSIGFFERARSGYEHGTSFKCNPLSFRLLIEREDNFHKLQTEISWKQIEENQRRSQIIAGADLRGALA